MKRVFVAVAAVLATAPYSASQTLRLTLLGTGNPRPTMERFGPSILVEADETSIVIDVGRGAIQRLFQIGSAEQIRAVDLILFTHLHSDHVVGFPDLWLTGWIFGRDRPLSVLGPPGTQAMCDHLEKAFTFDKSVRSGDEGYYADGILLEVRDVEPSVILDRDGLKITAFAVDHGGGVVPSYGYRVDFRGRSVAFSGDTRYYEPIVEHARGVDVLVHEVISPEVELRRAKVVGPGTVERVIAHHASPEQVGSIFAKVRPRLAVYSHIVPSPALAEDLIPPTRKTYDGPLAVGYDLMQIEIGDTIEVHPRRTGNDQ
ncbi:MAG TPA: MBL fold metallo-hydrolase [Vicinamibacteria bacterium]|nr:MBL fold metallo-hydrolase [Vicinamibacteria bacterium]